MKGNYPPFKKILQKDPLNNLFSHVCSSVPEHCYHIDFSFKIPLFGYLSMHHKFELISELFTGLCLKKTPLPKNGLKEYATLFSLYEFLRILIEVEVDTRNEFEGDCHEIESCCEEDKKELEEYYSKKPNYRDRFGKERDEYIEMRKKEDSKKKKGNEKKNPFLENFEYESEFDRKNSLIENSKERKSFLRSMKRINMSEYKVKKPKKMRKNDILSQIERSYDINNLLQRCFRKHDVVKKVNGKSCYCFNWRKLVVEVLEYQFNRNNKRGKKIHPTLCNYANFDFWNTVISFLISSHLIKLGMKDADLENVYHLMQGSLERSRTGRNRYDFILKKVQIFSEKYEKNWKVSNTMRAIAVLLCVPNGIVSEGNILPQYSKEHQRFLFKKLVSVEEGCKAIMKLIDEVNDFKKNNLKKHIFSNNFNLMMKESQRKYNDMDDVYFGIVSLKDEHIFISIDHMDITEHPRKCRLEKISNDKLWKCGEEKCYNEESLTKKFKVCSACKIERYCSQQCQKKHWKLHKYWCKKWKCKK